MPFKIEFMTNEVVYSELVVEVNGPSGPVRVDLDISPRGGKGLFIPEQVGLYEVSQPHLNLTFITISFFVLLAILDNTFFYCNISNIPIYHRND